MIVRCLVDLNNEGVLYLLTIQTEDRERLFKELKSFSNDVRYVEDKEEPSQRDKGDRILTDGSKVLRCQFFGDKVYGLSAFSKNAGKMAVINKAVSI